MASAISLTATWQDFLYRSFAVFSVMHTVCCECTHSFQLPGVLYTSFGMVLRAANLFRTVAAWEDEENKYSSSMSLAGVEGKGDCSNAIEFGICFFFGVLLSFFTW